MKKFLWLRVSLTDWFDCFLLTLNPSGLGEVWAPQSLAEVIWMNENIAKI